MRNIKFRSWVKSKNILIYDFTILDNDRCSENDKSILMQYTGLKDIHGKEIYEGDILNVSKEYVGTYIPVHVLFHEGCFMSQRVNRLTPPFSLIDNLSLYEIIGNIHENPELMEG